MLDFYVQLGLKKEEVIIMKSMHSNTYWKMESF